MQRGGSWDNSDVRGAKRRRWLSSDKKYASGGFRREQSFSVFGYGAGLDWTGTRTKGGPESILDQNYKAPNVNNFGT